MQQLKPGAFCPLRPSSPPSPPSPPAGNKPSLQGTVHQAATPQSQSLTPQRKSKLQAAQGSGGWRLAKLWKTTVVPAGPAAISAGPAAGGRPGTGGRHQLTPPQPRGTDPTAPVGFLHQVPPSRGSLPESSSLPVPGPVHHLRPSVPTRCQGRPASLFSPFPALLLHPGLQGPQLQL